MHCVVTAGPSYEPLDKVRRLTNFSTGRLGVDLAGFLAGRMHRVTLLLSEQALVRPAFDEVEIVPFTTTASLREALRDASRVPVAAVFHAAAVSDFAFGKVWRRGPDGELSPVEGGKLSTREGRLLAELLPTPKLIGELRDWFPDSWLAGWKYGVDGDRGSVLQAAHNQLATCRTNACVANGPAYGEGFGLVSGGGQHLHAPDKAALFDELLRMAAG